jgi:hypothetical protein
MRRQKLRFVSASFFPEKPVNARKHLLGLHLYIAGRLGRHPAERLKLHSKNDFEKLFG